MDLIQENRFKREIYVITSDQPFIWSGMQDLQWYPLSYPDDGEIRVLSALRTIV